MVYSIIDDRLIKQSLNSAKTVAMIGVSSIKTENPSNIIRRPSIIVMQYLQEFGYKVIPVNPSSVINEIEIVFSLKLPSTWLIYKYRFLWTFSSSLE